MRPLVFTTALALLATLACSDDPVPCDMPGEVITPVDENNPTIAPLIQRCRDNANDCSDLCEEVYRLVNGSAPATLMFEECHLTFVQGNDAVRYVELPLCAQMMEEM